jgi:hypothetical protein
MPWTASDTKRHNKKITSAKGKRCWAKVATSALARYGDEGRAIAAANAACGPNRVKSTKKRRTGR